MKKVYCLKGSKQKCPKGYIQSVAQDGGICKKLCTRPDMEKKILKKLKRMLKTRKRKVHKHKVRKHKVRKHKTRKHKTRKHKTRKHKTRKHKTRKHNGGGEGQSQESLSDCAGECQKYNVGNVISYTHYRMGEEPSNRTGIIVEIGKPRRGVWPGVCCYIIETAGYGRTFKYQVPCDDPTIQPAGQDAPEPVRRGGPGRRGPNNNYGLNYGINPQQSY